MPGTYTVPLSGNPGIDSLLTGVRWRTPSLTYGFPAAGSNWNGYATGSEPYDRLTPLTPAQRSAVQAALATWSSVANLTFTPVSEPGQEADLRYAGSGQVTTAQTYYPNSSPLGGDSWYSTRLTNAAEWKPGSYQFDTAVHETGHALGLKHPHDSSIGGAVSSEPLETSIMSYSSYPGAVIGSGYTVAQGSYPTGPMLDDIAAIQYLYGANYANNAGDSVYTFSPQQGTIFQTIWDGGGSDTYDLSPYVDGVTIDLQPGHWSSFGGAQLARLDTSNPARTAPGNVANAYLYGNDPRSLIENATGGAGSDSITGNDADNRLIGNGGDDTLTGGLGNDTLYGGAGNDRLDGGAGHDTAVFAGASTEYSITSAAGILTVNGTDGIDTLTAVEELRFSDRTLATDLVAPAAQAFRLYRAALDREPDSAGLKYQTNRLVQGVAIEDVAAGFIASLEFQAKYGALSNEAYVERLYLSVLDRSPMASEIAYHDARLDGGVSRQGVLVGFSESPENISKVAPSMGNALFLV